MCMNLLYYDVVVVVDECCVLCFVMVDYVIECVL